MKSMKNFLKILACLVAVLFIGCEKEEHDDHSHEGTLVFEKVNLDQIPLFERKFNADNDTYKKKISGNKSGNETINYFDLIIPEGINSELYDAANNLHYYTFALSIKEKNQLSNLVVKETLDGNKYYVCIFKSKDMDLWIESITNYNPDANVAVETELFELQLQDVNTEKSTTRPCWAETTSWRCPNDVHTAGQGDWLNCETFGAGGDGMARWTSSIHFMQVPCDNGAGGTGGSGTGGSGGDGGSGGGGGSGSGGGSSGSGPVVVQPNAPSLLSVFVSNLSPSQKTWWNSYANATNKIPMMSYLGQNNYSDASESFAKEVITSASTEPNQQDVNKLINLTLLIEKGGNTLFTEEFAATLKPYLDSSFSTVPPDYPLSSLTIKTFLDYRKLRQLNPEWSRARCIWHATRELVHLSLDVFGLVPVGGEIADLANGALYKIEGDDLNATLSFASAIPIAGWATASVKFAIKIKDVSQTAYTISTKVKLVWKNVGGTIIFGYRGQLRKVLGMGSMAVDARQAHHLIPWNLQTNPVVQKAAKSGSAFHMNEALNGIPLSTAVHSGSHGNYDGKIAQKLNDFINLNPNATPSECYTKVTQIIQQIRTAIQNNPGVPINQLNF